MAAAAEAKGVVFEVIELQLGQKTGSKAKDVGALKLLGEPEVIKHLIEVMHLENLYDVQHLVSSESEIADIIKKGWGWRIPTGPSKQHVSARHGAR